VRSTSRWIDAAIIAVVTFIIASLSRRWPGFNSPDSEFYASLALYGSDVVDRAIEPAYIWTRLGYIAPVRVLVTSVGPWLGFEIWRILLIAIIATSVYAMVHVAGRPRALGAALALFTGLNTVLLSYVGNTYLSGTAMAATFLVIALGVTQLGSAAAQGRGLFSGPRWITGGAIGAVLGWIVMTNPYTAILAGGTWIAIRLVVLIKLRTDRWKRLIIDAVAAAIGFVVSFGAFLIAGMLIFPGRNWLATYLEWNSRLDYTVFIGDPTTWQRDTGLLVLVIAVLAAAIASAALPARRWSWAALAISGATIAVTVVLMVAFTGPWLESPTYVAMLFPGALSALALVFIAATPGTHEDQHPAWWVPASAALIVAPLLVWSGRYDGVLGQYRGWAIAGVMVAVLAVLVIVVRSQPRFTALTGALLVLALAVTYTGAQLLQNGRGILGIYGQYPFAAAYLDFNGREQMAAKIEVQQWLLDRTDATDAIAIWTDPAGLGASTAAMQMWGGDNLVTLDATLDRNTTTRLEQIRPTAIAMYAPTQPEIDAFYASLPPWSLPSPMECITVPFPVVASQQMHACLTHLRWVG